MEVAFVALTETCTFLLDADGICRFSVLRPEADKTTREAAKRCLGAQYVASIDRNAEGLLVHEPQPGRQLLFARVSDTGRVALVRSGPLLEFQVLDPPQDASEIHPPKSLVEADAKDSSELLTDEHEAEEEAKPTEDFREVIRAEASAALDALEQTNELGQAQPLEADAEEEEEIDLPLSEEIKLALDRLDDLPMMDASLPLDRPSSPVRLDDEVTVERPSAVPPPLSEGILGSMRGEQLANELARDLPAPPSPSSQTNHGRDLFDLGPPSPSSLAERGLAGRPSSPQSPENMLAKVMLDDDIGEDIETLLVVDQHAEVETENTDETMRFTRHIPIAAGSEPITMKAPATLKGFPPPQKPSLVRRRGLLPRITRQ